MAGNAARWRQLVRSAAFIGGRWEAAANGRTFAVTNPASGHVIGHVPDLCVSATRRAIDAAHQRQTSWQNTAPKYRSQLLYKLYRLLEENRRDLAALLTAEQGKPLSEAGGEISYGNSFIEWFAALARNINGEVIAGSLPDRECFTFRQAAGVAALITPWNFPFAMITRKLGAALACGCCCVLKPAEDTPLTALAIAQLAANAGLPEGTLSVVTASRDSAASIGAELCSDPRVAVLSFTGSTRVGKQLYSQCASTVKKISLELGGNSPLIVFNSADLKKAVSGCMTSKFRNAGQTCISANRILVQSGIYDEFVPLLQTTIETQLKVGDGAESGVNIGPLINDAQFERVSELVSASVKEGATLCLGGGGHVELGGRFYLPTMLTDVTPSMAVFRHEVFGPVVSICRFETEEESIDLANDCDMGLAAYIFTEDMAQAFSVGRRLQYGSVAVNEGIVSQAETPIGGMKQSGVGREGGHYSIEDYTEVKYMCIGTKR